MGKTAVKIQDGVVINVTAVRDVKGGDFYPFGKRAVVVVNDVSQGELVGLYLEGVFRVNVNTADTVALGDSLYLDIQGGGDNPTSLTTDAGDSEVPNPFVGYACTEKAADVAGACDVKLG